MEDFTGFSLNTTYVVWQHLLACITTESVLNTLI